MNYYVGLGAIQCSKFYVDVGFIQIINIVESVLIVNSITLETVGYFFMLPKVYKLEVRQMSKNRTVHSIHKK